MASKACPKGVKGAPTEAEGICKETLDYANTYLEKDSTECEDFEFTCCSSAAILTVHLLSSGLLFFVSVALYVS